MHKGLSAQWWLWLSCALVWLCTQGVRAEVPAEWLGDRIVEARVVGAQAGRIDDATLGIPRGEALSRTLIRGTIARLLAEGRYSDVQVDAVRVEGGVALLFHLTPRYLVRRVEVVGNHVLKDRDLLRLIGVHEEGELAPEEFPGWVADIRESYTERGYPFATARILVRDMDDPTHKVVRVEVKEGDPVRIAVVRFVGDQLPRGEGFSRLLGFDVGDVADVDRIENGLVRAEEELRRRSYYEAGFGKPRIEREGKRAIVSIPSHIGPPYEVRFIGQEPLSPSELFEKLGLDQERLSGEANLRAIEQKLLDIYRRYSFRDVEVKIDQHVELRQHRAETTGATWTDPVMVLAVHIRTFAQTEVDAVTFPGASYFSERLLRAQLYSYLEEDLPGSSLREPVDSALADQLGFGGGKSGRAREQKKPMLLDPHRMFYAPSYEQAIEHLRELYRAEGFLDVRIGEPKLEPLENDRVGAPPPDPRTHVVGVIPIDEGPRTFVYDVHIEDNEYLTSYELLQAAELARGTPFSYLKLEEARLRVLEACQEKGHFFAKVEPEVRVSDDGTRAEVTFRVDEGYVVRVGAVEVRGNERSSRKMILNRVRFREGDLYTPSLARKSQDLLLGLDVFTTVTVAPEDAELPARIKNVIVSVTERKTQWLGWSAGFSTGEGMRGGFEYGYRNLLSSAIHASLRAQIGYQFVFLDEQIKAQYLSLSTSERIEYQTTLTLGIPYLPRLPKNTASVDLTVLADIQRDFRIQKQSAVLTFLWRPFKRLTLTVAEELEASDFQLLALRVSNSNRIPFSLLVPDGQNTLSATQLAVSYDLRDRAYNPRRGVLISFSPEYDKTLSAESSKTPSGQNETFKSNMLRLIGSFAFYIPLGPKLTFASQWRYGRIVHLEKGSASYPNRLFYLGGPNFRGYQINQVVPQDVRDDPNVDQSNIVSHGGQTFLAGQSELRFPIYGDLFGGVFTDIGNLWADPRALELRQLMVVAGAGLRLQTPVASLAFDYGVRDITRGFHFVGAFQFAFQTF